MRPIDTQLQRQQQMIAEQFRQLELSHPQWADLYETADFSSPSNPDVMELLSTAPNGFAAGLIYGKISVLRSIESAESYRGHNFQVISSNVDASIGRSTPQLDTAAVVEIQTQELPAAHTARASYSSLPTA
jgi:hypothetical protein